MSFDYLICIMCGGGHLSESSNSLKCDNCKAEFPIVNGIPIMLNPKDVNESKKQLMEYYANESKVYNVSHGSDLGGADYNIKNHYMQIFEEYIPKGGKFLEFGAGTGKFSSIFKGFGDELYLTDFSLEMLDINREKLLPRIVADTEKLPFSDNYFDCCLGITTFSYLPDKKKGIKEIIRVLKPGGKIIIIDQNRINFIFALAKLYYFSHRKLNRQPQIAESNIFSYKRLFKDAGIEITKSGSFSWVPHALPVFVVKLLSPFDFILSKTPGLKNFAMRLFIVGEKKKNV